MDELRTSGWLTASPEAFITVKKLTASREDIHSDIGVTISPSR
jgi:hypothetical protein